MRFSQQTVAAQRLQAAQTKWKEAAMQVALLCTVPLGRRVRVNGALRCGGTSVCTVFTGGDRRKTVANSRSTPPDFVTPRPAPYSLLFAPHHLIHWSPLERLCGHTAATLASCTFCSSSFSFSDASISCAGSGARRAVEADRGRGDSRSRTSS